MSALATGISTPNETRPPGKPAGPHPGATQFGRLCGVYGALASDFLPFRAPTRLRGTAVASDTVVRANPLSVRRLRVRRRRAVLHPRGLLQIKHELETRRESCPMLASARGGREDRAHRRASILRRLACRRGIAVSALENPSPWQPCSDPQCGAGRGPLRDEGPVAITVERHAPHAPRTVVGRPAGQEHTNL